MKRHQKYHPEAQKRIESFQVSIVDEAQLAIKEHDVVVIGMFLNPYVLIVRFALNQSKIPYHYLQYGGYFSKWRPRLAIKIWSGWPTFPQVFAAEFLPLIFCKPPTVLALIEIILKHL